jgi:adenylylsulfate kinase-like enzyme
MELESTNVIPHKHNVSQEDRSRIKEHSPAVLWFTGLSGSGKSTIANQLELVLNQKYSLHTYLLDGDNIRTGLNKDLGFSDHDRTENIRRIAEVARLFYDSPVCTPVDPRESLL